MDDTLAPLRFIYGEMFLIFRCFTLWSKGFNKKKRDSLFCMWKFMHTPNVYSYSCQTKHAFFLHLFLLFRLKFGKIIITFVYLFKWIREVKTQNLKNVDTWKKLDILIKPKQKKKLSMWKSTYPFSFFINNEWNKNVIYWKLHEKQYLFSY